MAAHRPISEAAGIRKIVVDGQPVPLSSGLSVVADVRTGSRRIISWLLSPIQTTVSQAGRERGADADDSVADGVADGHRVIAAVKPLRDDRDHPGRRGVRQERFHR